jgi:enediyne biosynthesis protein E4
VDLDNDGWLDLLVAGGGLDVQDAQTNRVFLNNARGNHPGRFLDVSNEAGPGLSQPALHRGVVFADFDRDGRIDAAVTALNAPIELWWNRSSRENSARHWLQLRLTGKHSNRSAIGVVVRCIAGSRTQSRTVSSSVGYASSSDLTAHFGLGAAERAVIDIKWPSGREQNLGELAADQRLAKHI